MTAELEAAGAVLWIVAALVEILVRRYEHRRVLRLLAKSAKAERRRTKRRVR